MNNKLNEYIWSMCTEVKKIQKIEADLEKQEKNIAKFKEKIIDGAYEFYLEREAISRDLATVEKNFKELEKDNTTANETKLLELKDAKDRLLNELKTLKNDNKEINKFCKENEELLKRVEKANEKYEELNEKYIEKKSSFEDSICEFKRIFDESIDTKPIENIENEEKEVVVHWMYGPMVLEKVKKDCLVYKVLFPEYISKYVPSNNKKEIIKRFPLDAQGSSAFALGYPIKHFSFLYK